MSENHLVIIQSVGFFSSKAQHLHSTNSIRLPKFKLNSDTVAVAHNCRTKNDSQIVQYNSLIFAQPNRMGLKLEGDQLVVMPYSSHPYGMQKDIKLDLGETARIEWSNLEKIHKTRGHYIINIAYCSREIDPDIFYRYPKNHMFIEMTQE